MRENLSVSFNTRQNQKVYCEIGSAVQKMKIWILLLLGVCSTQWTYGYKIQRGHYLSRINNGTLRSVIPMIVGFYLSRTINLSGLKLRRINRNVFNELGYVKKLNLSNNELERLPPLLFANMTNLRTLVLADNRIHVLNRNFVGLNRLTSLNLSNNLISSVSKADLIGLTKSAHIIMDRNPLKMLKVGTKQGNMLGNPWNALRVYDMHSVDLSQQDFKDEPYFQSYLSAFDDPNFVQPHVKLCKTDEGSVASVRVVKMNESIGECFSIDMIRESVELNLNGLGLKKFQRGWLKVPGEPFRTLNLANNQITEITPELLNDLPKYMTTVNLQNNKIKLINNIENRFLKKLQLDYNSIAGIEDGAFEKTNLVSISVKSNHLTSLDFARTLPRTIQELILDGNEVSYVPERSLMNLKALKHLTMSVNYVTQLPLGVFRGLKELRAIDLSNNLLETIEPGTFEDQEKLSTLILSSNSIRELNPEAFNGLRMVDTIDLRRNKIRKISRNSFSGLEKSIISKVNLLDNEIDTIEEGSFANMTIESLLLAGNKISATSIAKGAFESCTLNWLSLASNSLASINGDSFYGIRVHYSINFNGNNIGRIKHGAAKYMRDVRQLDLRGNGVERLQNGAFYGLRKSLGTKIMLDSSIKVIYGGVFDGVLSKQNIHQSREQI